MTPDRVDALIALVQRIDPDDEKRTHRITVDGKPERKVNPMAYVVYRAVERENERLM